MSGYKIVSVPAPPLIERDPDYDWMPPRPEPDKGPRGMQCGVCGMKFEYGKAYGYVCSNARCPTGFAGPTCTT